jgi:hypothetical protein
LNTNDDDDANNNNNNNANNNCDVGCHHINVNRREILGALQTESSEK